MLSKYDNIATAAEMVEEVMIHGLSTNPEDLSRVSDIFGHSTIEELSFLANDIGRNNEYGEPDPKGTWSSGRRPTRGVFYMILFNIWNWEDATHFWNLYSNPEREELMKLRKDYDRLASQLDKQVEHTKLERENFVKKQQEFHEAESEIAKLKDALSQKDVEILKLKSKLYDMMTS